MPDKPMTTLRLVLLSDTHTLHREVDVPDGDLLIHAGDHTCFSRSMAEVKDFNAWLGELSHRYKIVVPGNHESYLEADPRKYSMLSNATVLIDEAVEIEGLKIWGSPTTPLYGGAFGRSSPSDRRRLYAQIPSGTDIIITHGPPYTILDSAPGSEVHAGDPELLEAVLRIQSSMHIFGHVHAQGVCEVDGITFVNAALMGKHGGLVASPLVFDMRRQK